MPLGGRALREDAARAALHAALSHATRCLLEGEPRSPSAGAPLDQHEREVASLVQAEPLLAPECFAILARCFESESSAALLKASRVLGAALSAEGAAVGHCARRHDGLMARLDALSSSYALPPLPVDEEPLELLRGSSLEGQFRSVSSQGVEYLVDLASGTVATVEGDEEVGSWDEATGMIQLSEDRAAEAAVRLAATALLRELKLGGGGGKTRAVAASLQQAMVSVSGGVAAGAQVAAVKLADDRLGLGRASWTRQEGQLAREEGARDALHAALYHATRCVDGEAPPAPGAVLTVAELEVAALIRAEPLLGADCVDALARSFQSDSSVVLLKAARVLGAALSAADGADSGTAAGSSSQHQRGLQSTMVDNIMGVVTSPDSVACCVRRSSLIPRMVALSRYSGAHQTEDTGGLDGSLRTGTKTIFSPAFDTKREHFTKTGSGQT